MDDSLVILGVLFLIMLVMYFVVGAIGNKVVDKTGDAFQHAATREAKAKGDGKTENLADRFK